MALQTPGNAKSAAASSARRALSYEDIASSKPFRFSVGPQRREFTIHSALVSGQSPALNRLVNGGFKEAQDGHAELESVEEETFIRFVQYAYTGQYSGAEPEDSVLEAPEVSTDCGGIYASAVEEMYESQTYPEDDVSFFVHNGTRRAKIWVKFRQSVSALHISTEEPYHVTAVQPTPQNPLLSHARVFVFADYWGVTRLRELSLQKLGISLRDHKLTSARVEEVVSLLEYCYDEARPDELTSLLLLYAACMIDILWKSERFQGVFSRHGELARALMGAMVETA